MEMSFKTNERGVIAIKFIVTTPLSMQMLFLTKCTLNVIFETQEESSK